MNDELLFIPKARADELAAVWQALGEAKTRGEFRESVSAKASEELLARLGRLPPADNRFPGVELEPVSDGDYPGLVTKEMFGWMPQAIIDTFGVVEPSMLNGDLLAFRPEDKDDIIVALPKAGYDCERNDELVSRAAGY